MNREQTKAKSTLRILGEGILIYTLWDVIRPFILILLPQSQTDAEAELPFQLSELSEEAVLPLLLGVLLFCLLYVGLRLYAGLAQKSMVTNAVFRSGSLLAGFSVDFAEKGFRGIRDYRKLLDWMREGE
jgi:hypothetical protein